MDDPEGHEVRQSHLSCPAEAGAGRSAGDEYVTLTAIYVRVSTAENKSEMGIGLGGFGVVGNVEGEVLVGVRS